MNLMQYLIGTTPNRLTLEGTLVFDTSNTALVSIYYPMVYLASDFPMIITSKKYIILYSTDHASSANGKIAWGDADNIDFSDFTERGIIFQTGYQSETPAMLIAPDDPNGETLHFYLHTDASDPANGGYQQTKLYTTSGGAALHECTFTNRGNILGMVNAGTDEFHTGYTNVYRQSDGSMVAIHHTKGYNGATVSQINRFGKSTNPGNSYVWTRISSHIDNTFFMPSGRAFHISPPSYFTIRGVQYVFGINMPYSYTVEGRKIAVAKCANGDYLPTHFIGDISSVNGGDNPKLAGFFIDDINPNIMHIYYTKSPGPIFSNPGTELYHTTWNLSNL